MYPDDVMKQLGLSDAAKELETHKLTNFEESSVGAVLKQLGWSAGQVAHQKHELQEGFGWDWFNDEGLVTARVGSTREFRFNFFDLLRKPVSHPITEAFLNFRGTSTEPCCLIFYVYGQGRWVATNLTTLEDCSLHVSTSQAIFNVLPFEKFFSNRWGPSEEPT
jgi:hypothetical protein